MIIEIKKKYPKLKANFYHEYGNMEVIRKYCGLDRIPKYVAINWQHGHIIPEKNIHPEFVINSDGLSRKRKFEKYFVAREDQVNYLLENGYEDVVAIGMPIIYVDKPKVIRIKGSLLIMPSHYLNDTNENFDEEVYAQYIDSIRHQFTQILCCIHESCYKKGYWVETFRKRQVEVIVTSSESDANTLDRLSYLFSKFEFLTTNDFGSQLAYGSYFGIKPSISGPKPLWQLDHYLNVEYYKNAPELLKILENWYNNDFIKQTYSFLFVEPFLATNQEEWAKFQLGHQYKKHPNEIKKLFSLNFNLKKYNMMTFRKIKTVLNYLQKKVINIFFWLEHFKDMMIFSHLTLEEKKLLLTLSEKNNGIIVEIGSYLGSSSCFLAAGLQNNDNSTLYCIDTWGNHCMIYDEDDNKDNNLVEKDTYAEFLKNTNKYKKKIKTLRGWSFEVVKHFEENGIKIDMLFIDGDHDYEGVKKDWEDYSKHLNKNAIIVFHDTGWATGVRKVINEKVISTATLIAKLENMEAYKLNN